MDNNVALIAQCEAKAKQWLTPDFDETTRKAVQAMLDNADKTELVESFYRDLEFGTGGLRGIMGAGTNRMNIYTVGMATQGFANYLKKNFKDRKQISTVVCYDCRNNSDLYARTVANIFSANGIKVYLFDEMRPTPECSFAIRHFGAQGGVNLTASHNPREYNGYKAYWEDGAQVLAPHDKGIIDEVGKVTIADVKFEGNKKCEGCSAFQLVGDSTWRVAYIEYSSKPKRYRICQADEKLANFHSPVTMEGVKHPQHGSFMRLTEEEYKRLQEWSDSIMRERAARNNGEKK